MNEYRYDEEWERKYFAFVDGLKKHWKNGVITAAVLAVVVFAGYRAYHYFSRDKEASAKENEESLRMEKESKLELTI